MDKLFLKTDLVTGNTLTEDGVLAYIALRTLVNESIPLYNRTSSTDCISVNRLAYLLIGEMDYDKALTDALVRGIAELASGEWISIRKDLSIKKNYEYVLDLEKIWLDTEKGKFTVVYPNDVYRIMTCNEKMDKRIRMLKYYVALVSTFDWELDAKIGHMSQEYIAGQADCSVKSCQRYNDILAEMQMIYVYKSNDKVRDGDKLKQIKNCYSRYEDRSLCERYASDYEDMYGVEHKIVRTKKSKEKADNNRRLAQIYNRICDGHASDYDEETIKKVHKYIVNKNKSLQEQIDEKNHQKYLTACDESWIEKLESQIRDEDIFGQFDFLNGEPNNSVLMMHDFSVEEMLDMPTMGDSRKVDRELLSQNSSKATFNSESLSQNSSKAYKEDLHLIDIESLFDDESKSNKSNKIVLTREEAEELFA